ncbi:unnamed protein product, partial [Parnassius apollo]
KILV